jgi:hypothetical protein
MIAPSYQDGIPSFARNVALARNRERNWQESPAREAGTERNRVALVHQDCFNLVRAPNAQGWPNGPLRLCINQRHETG